MPAQAQLYRWVDDEGRITLSTFPQPGAPFDQELRNPARPTPTEPKSIQPQRMTAPRPPVETRPAKAAAEQEDRTVTIPPMQVTIFATGWCPYCARARAFFQTYRVAFQELDIEKSAAAHATFKKLGGGGVPLIVIDGRIIHGFDEAKLGAALGLR